MVVKLDTCSKGPGQGGICYIDATTYFNGMKRDEGLHNFLSGKIFRKTFLSFCLPLK